MLHNEIMRKESLLSRVVAITCAVTLAVSLTPLPRAQAYAADDGAGALHAASLTGAQNDENILYGGEEIDQGGTYTLAANAAGNISISQPNLNVAIVGNGAQFNDNPESAEYGKVSSTPNSGLYISCAEGTSLTLKDVYISNGDGKNSSIAANTINFTGDNNSLIIDGTVIIDHNGNADGYAAIHVPNGSDLTISGNSGSTFYLYKREQGAGIGGDNQESCGAITLGTPTSANDFYVFAKGSKQGAVIGNGANESGTPGDITVNKGIYNLQANARGALFGGGAGDSSGAAGNVCVKGGLLNLFVDWTGAAIGGGGFDAGNDKEGGNAYLEGGSVRTYVTENAKEKWPGGAGVNDAAITAKKVKKGNDENVPVYLMAIPVDVEQGNHTVVVDRAQVYSGPSYAYAYSETTTDTPGNWRPDSSESNLYVYATGENHKLIVDGKYYAAEWDGEASAFTLSPIEGYEWYVNPAEEGKYVVTKSSELAELATIVNGTVDEKFGIAQDDFSGKTVTLAGDIDLSAIEDWTPIASDYDHAFKGTFDGAGKAITGLTVVGGDASYQGLFGCNDGLIKNFSIAGSITGTSGDYYGGVAGFNFGAIEDVMSSVDISAASVYNMGGIAGFNTSGIWVIADSNRNNVIQPTFDDAVGVIQCCGWEGTELKAANKVGGIVGENAGTVRECFSGTGTISAPGSQKGGAGGIVGRNGCNNAADETGFVDSCYSFATVGSSGDRFFGGIVGFQNNTYGKQGKTPVSSTSNCYFAGTIVSGYSTNWGPIVGNSDGGSIPAIGSNNYSLEGILTGGSSEIQQGIVKTADEMKATDFVVALNGAGGAFNYDIDSVNDGYPVLAWQGGVPSSFAEQAIQLKKDAEEAKAAADAAAEEAEKAKAEAKDAQDKADAATSDAEKAKAEAKAAQDKAAAAEAEAAKQQEAAKAAQAAADAAKADAKAAQKTDLSGAAVTVAKATYTGKALEPAVTVRLSGKELKAGADYAVTYANNKNAGTAVAVVAGKGSYTGAATKTFAIAKAANTLKLKGKKVTLKASALESKAKTVKVAKVRKVSKNASKGKLTYKKASGDKKIVVAKNGKVTVKKGLKAGTYKVKVKATSAATANYKKKAASFTFTVVVK